MSLNCTVISLVPLKIVEEKPGLYPPRFIIEESNGTIPQLLHVSTAVHYVYLDESRGMLQVKDPADVVARAIVHDFCTSQLGISDEVGPALWWSEEDLDLEKVMVKERTNIIDKKARQRKWFVNLVKMADDDWIRYHQHNVISDFQRKIGHMLDLNPDDHEWMVPLALQQGKTQACPFCGTSIVTGAVICSNCHQIIDHKRKKEIEQELMKDASNSNSK
jgi:hypothetical protein